MLNFLMSSHTTSCNLISNQISNCNLNNFYSWEELTLYNKGYGVGLNTYIYTFNYAANPHTILFSVYLCHNISSFECDGSEIQGSLKEIEYHTKFYVTRPLMSFHYKN